MPHMRRRSSSLFALFAISLACQPAEADTRLDLDDEVVLTAAEPVAAFEVTLCLSGEPPNNGLHVYGSFYATARTSQGEVVEVTLESLDAPGDESTSPFVDVVSATTASVDADISLYTERDWEAEGRRCQEQVVQVSVPDLAEGQSVVVSDLYVTMLAQWSSFCGPGVQEESLSIEVVRL